MLSVLLSILIPPAAACGGFACDNQLPVLQAAERIAFGVDRDEGIVEMHVQVTYEGPSEDFAWIVPAPSDPEIFLTTGLLFSQFPRPTQPTFTLDQRTEGTCWAPRSGDKNESFTDMAPSSLDSSGDDDDSSDYFDVEILDKQALGPYLIVELTAASVDDLTGWLQENGFDVPDDIGPMLEPYLLADNVFVALKLAKDSDAGDLAPLAMRFAADRAAVPVQLTAMAAAPDMRMETYVFSDSRAVPESYLHVQINEAAVDWWNQGANYNDVITQAADEAGGHAFATDFHGPTTTLPTLYAGGYQRDRLLAQTNAVDWTDLVLAMLTQIPPELAEVVEVHVPGVDAPTFIACPSCGTPPSGPFDPVAATDDLELMVIEPLTAAQALADRFDYVTRMTSSLDAVEMTVDPTFVLNDDLASEEIPVAHAATLVTDCTPKRTRETDALRYLELADGRQLWMPSTQWMEDNGTTPFEYLEEHGALAAQVIEQLGETGSGEVLTDHTPDLFALADLRKAELLRGCGCTTSGAPGSAAGVLGLLGLVGLRRRRAHRARR
jgi:MYXO-CTERM domain-containing protein